MEFLHGAFEELGISYSEAKVSYSARFNGYNANIRKHADKYDIRMSSKWKGVDEEIQKGCVQTILKKLFKLRQQTSAIKLYNKFLKALGEYAERTESDPYLAERFQVLNEEYFGGMMSQPNLEWGSKSYRILGRYEYSTDTVRISTILRDEHDLLDFVLYHELLHKKHKFRCAGTQMRHHTKEFRAEEAKFRIPNAQQALQAFVAQKRKQQIKRPLWKRLLR